MDKTSAAIMVPAILVIAFAVVTMASVIPEFFDPCHEWGIDAGEGGHEVGLDDTCPSRSGSSQTRAEAALQLVGIQGVLLLSGGATLMGAVRGDRVWTATGATLLLVLVPPFGLGIFWVLLLVAAFGLFFGASRQPLGSGAGAWGLWLAFGTAATGTLLVVAYLWSVDAKVLALLSLGMGAIGIGLMAFFRRRSQAARID